MQKAVRSYLTAGVGLAGASVIALSPVAPPLPDVQVPALPDVVHTRALQLAADFDLRRAVDPREHANPQWL
jgi:hypothetical protein